MMNKEKFKHEFYKKSSFQWEYIKLMCVMSASIAGPLKAKITRESDDQIVLDSIDMASKLMSEVFARI